MLAGTVTFRLCVCAKYPPNDTSGLGRTGRGGGGSNPMEVRGINPHPWDSQANPAEGGEATPQLTLVTSDREGNDEEKEVPSTIRCADEKKGGATNN